MINNIQLKRSNFKFINQDISRISLLLLIQSDIHPFYFKIRTKCSLLFHIDLNQK